MGNVKIQKIYFKRLRIKRKQEDGSQQHNLLC